jgi:hypothetical protein
MLSLVIFGSFFALALAGIPLMVALLATTAGIVSIYGMQYPLESVFLSWFSVDFTVIFCSLRDNPVFQNYQKHYEGHRAV